MHLCTGVPRREFSRSLTSPRVLKPWGTTQGSAVERSRMFSNAAALLHHMLVMQPSGTKEVAVLW